MLSSVTLNCQVTKNVMNSGSQLSEMQSMSQMTKVTRIALWRCSFNVFVFVIVMSCPFNHSDQMSQRSQFSRIAPWRCSLNVFVFVIVIVFVFVFVIVFLLVRSCLIITLIKCLKGHKSLRSLCHCVFKKVPHSLTEWETFWKHNHRVTLETCDLWDIWSEWWEDMTCPTKIQWERQIQRQWQWQRQKHLENTFKERP